MKPLLILFFTGFDAKWCIQWTKADETCEQEDSCQYKQYNPQCTTYGSCIVEYCNCDRYNDPNDPICCAHVLFHNVGFSWLNFGQ